MVLRYLSKFDLVIGSSSNSRFSHSKREADSHLLVEFIFDEWQILEARLAGADTCLLIVKMLDQTLLKKLYLYSLSLGMEPLVEVNNVEEMEIAIRLGAKVVGVNNRNLTNFEVDLDTTSRLMEKVPRDTIVCALRYVCRSNQSQSSVPFNFVKFFGNPYRKRCATKLYQLKKMY